MTDAEPPSLDAQAFRLAMQQLAATVTVVAIDPAQPVGMTATAVMSLSAAPPSIVVSINRATALGGKLRLGALLCVNALASGQDEICRAFGGGAPGPERFKLGTWRLDNVAPYLEEAVANIFAQVEQLVEFGTHTLVIARLIGLRLEGGRDPLVYLRGEFHDLQSRHEAWGMPL